MPSALSPASTTAQPAGLTEMTEVHRYSAGRNAGAWGRYSVSMRQYDPAWISVAHGLQS